MNKSIIPLVIALSLNSAAIAETAIEEVIVESSLLASTVQDAASSVSVIDSEALQQQQAVHLSDVIGLMPNVNFSQGSSRPRYFQIRGIGERSQFVEPLIPSVGLMLDGIDFTGLGAAATLMDVERVEVLRGPQGTAFGASGLAGVFHILSAQPTEEFDAVLSGTFANYSTQQLQGMINIPTSVNSAMRLAVQNVDSDGATTNLFLNRPTQTLDELNARGRWQWRGDNQQFDLIALYADIDNGYDAFSLDNVRDTLSDQPGFDRQTTRALAMKWQGQIANNQHYEINAATTDTKVAYGYDEDWVYDGFHPWGYSSFDAYYRDKKQRNIEFKLFSENQAENNWVVGVFASTMDESLVRDYTYDVGYDSEHTTETVALFGQQMLRISDIESLEIGLRFEKRDAEFRNDRGANFSPSSNLWGGSVSWQRIVDNGMAYFRLARGYKANGFNTDGTIDEDLRLFDDEQLVELEAGWKTSPTEASQLRLAIFYDWRRDQQVKSSVIRVRQGGASEFIAFTGNAAKGSNYGAEIEYLYQRQKISFYTTLGLLKTNFDQFVNSAGDDLSGRDQAQAPHYSFAIGTQYQLNQQWMWSLDYTGKDRYYFSDSHNEQSTAYQLLSSQLQFQMEQWRVALWGKNLLNTRYYTRGFGGFGNDPRNGYATDAYFQLGEPRTFGVTLEWRLKQ